MSKILSDEDGDTIWNDPTPNIDDEIDKICQTLAWAGSYIDSGQQVVDEISIEKATQAISQLITDARVEAVQELKRRWNDDRKTMDYSPATYQFICDKYIKELKENKR